MAWHWSSAESWLAALRPSQVSFRFVSNECGFGTLSPVAKPNGTTTLFYSTAQITHGCVICPWNLFVQTGAAHSLVPSSARNGSSIRTNWPKNAGNGIGRIQRSTRTQTQRPCSWVDEQRLRIFRLGVCSIKKQHFSSMTHRMIWSTPVFGKESASVHLNSTFDMRIARQRTIYPREDGMSAGNSFQR
jgi:hypothetical protein